MFGKIHVLQSKVLKVELTDVAVLSQFCLVLKYRTRRKNPNKFTFYTAIVSTFAPVRLLRHECFNTWYSSKENYQRCTSAVSLPQHTTLLRASILVIFREYLTMRTIVVFLAFEAHDIDIIENFSILTA